MKVINHVDQGVDILEKEIESSESFHEDHVLHELKHYLPAQASLKDFIHHNTLHAFQTMKFHQGRLAASEILGYRVSLSLKEFRDLYASKVIREDVLEQTIIRLKGKPNLESWLKKVKEQEYANQAPPRIGALRSHWKRLFRTDLDSLVHPLLFRLLCAYLDQGISMWGFPMAKKGFLEAIRELERLSFTSLFRKKRAKKLLLETSCEIKDLLKIVVGDESLYERYLFDQQFAHQGWAGMVSVVESFPETLLDTRTISIKDLIRFELLLEIDALDYHLGETWTPLGASIKQKPLPLFAPTTEAELNDVIIIWQEAFEWSYYDDVLAGLQNLRGQARDAEKKSFQAVFCIDDRECSLRRHLEKFDPNCGTFGTPGFFSSEFYFQPLDGKFYTKVCPAPVTPKFLIKEVGIAQKRETDMHFTKHTHSLFRGWIISQTLGFWAALRLLINIFKTHHEPRHGHLI